MLTAMLAKPFPTMDNLKLDALLSLVRQPTSTPRFALQKLRIHVRYFPVRDSSTRDSKLDDRIQLC